MITDKNAYNEIQKEIAQYTNGLISQEEIDSFNQHIQTKLENFKPTLMIYGTYNAGKSTLLNALFGQEEMAKTGDAPETKDIHEYTYNGYTIYDTPGLNARSEDDITTAEHLEKSEVVLFVLSNNGSLEEDYVYNKISEVIKANKPIIIVLNNKSGIEPNSIEANESMIKVGENLQKIANRTGIKNIENKVSICMVNAKSALKGKLENKKLILKKSNIAQLEDMIEKLLNSAGSEEVINALNIYIQNFIQRNIEIIDSKIDNKELQKIEELITFLEKFKSSSNIKMKNIVSKTIPSLTENLTSMLLSEGASKDDINKYIENMIEDINNQIFNVSKNIESELKTKIDNFTTEFNKLNVDYQDINSEEASIAQDESVIPDNIKNIAKDIITDKKATTEATKNLLTMAKKLLPKEIMHGKGPVWIEKAAGKAAIGISVLMEAYNMYSANKEHQEMIQAEKNKILGAKNNAKSIADDIELSLFNNIDELISETFNNLIISFRDTSNKLNTSNTELLNKKIKLQSISNRL